MLVRPGVRAIPYGIAAVALGVVLRLPGTLAGPADVGPSVSVFGTIHPEIYRYRAPIGSEHPVNRVRVASLDPGIGDITFDEADMLADKRAPASESESASFEERFAALDDKVASFDERFGSAARKRTGDLQVPQDEDVEQAVRTTDQLADAPPIPIPAKRHVRPGQASKDPGPLADDGRTAIYDISARTVYLPNGRRLEAHSGLGAYMDSPRHVNLRMRGATPPNVYKLSLRERLFHGVRAIRLTPVDEGKMHGRAGILAHTYMLGSNGQSNGCVSFRNYPEFLKAYLKGEVTRLVVVEHLDSPPSSTVASGWLPNAIRNLFGGSNSGGQYASANTY
ncbi:MAG: DUF2778 domain-containing protein [Rhodoplanes sp.]